MALAVAGSLPILLVFVLAQKCLASGLSLGAVKWWAWKEQGKRERLLHSPRAFHRCRAGRRLLVTAAGDQPPADHPLLVLIAMAQEPAAYLYTASSMKLPGTQPGPPTCMAFLPDDGPHAADEVAGDGADGLLVVMPAFQHEAAGEGGQFRVVAAGYIGGEEQSRA